MISHNVQELRQRLQTLNIGKQRADAIVQQCCTEKPISRRFYVKSGRLFADESFDAEFAVLPLVAAQMTDNMLQDCFMGSDADGTAEAGLRCCCATVISPSSQSCNIIQEIVQPEFEPHELSLSDIQIEGKNFSVRGRNLTSLDFGAGGLRDAFGDLRHFDFSGNPALKISQIQQFININKFNLEEAYCCGVENDNSADDRYIIYEYEHVAKEVEIPFCSVQPGRRYPLCRVLHLSAAELERLDLAQFPTLTALEVSFDGAFRFPEKLAKQLEKQNILLRINGQICVFPLLFINSDNNINIEQEDADIILENLEKRAWIGKILFQKAVRRCVSADGVVSVENAAGNSALCVFEGPVAAFARRASLEEANFAAIYHGSSDIFMIIVEIHSVNAGDEVVVADRFFDREEDNEAFCAAIGAAANGKLICEAPATAFQASVEGIVAAAEASAHYFIGENMRLYQKWHVIELLIAGVLIVAAPVPQKAVLVEIDGEEQNVYIITEKGEQTAISLTRCGANCINAVKWLDELLGYRPKFAKIIANAEMTEFTLLKAKK